MKHATRFIAALLTLICAATHTLAAPPNIIVVLCDDLGYGDLRCLNPAGKIATPHLDRLASEGVTFTDAHTGSSVCTPTRYGLMTGRYCWRTKLQSFVLGGLSPRLIEPDRLTIASLLKQQGYYTGCVGKWHLGMNWVLKPGGTVTELGIEPREQVWNVDYSQPIADGPNAVGFDYYYGISASLDMVPYTYIENNRVTKLPTEDRDFPLFMGREARRCRQGPTAPGFEVEDVLPELTRKAIEYVDGRASDAKQGKPFFLYLPLASPHTPIAPSKEWREKSGLNFYGDFVMETDAAIGKLLAALDRNGLRENTIVVVTSDNGCSPSADYPELLSKGHNPSFHFRGHKADIFEGGHRVPFIVRWPAKAPAGKQSSQVVCLTDMLATCAEALDVKVADNAGEDSFSFLPSLLDPTKSSQRKSIVHHSINGSFAIREGNWKLALCGDSGGWSDPRPNTPAAKNLPPVQLFDLASDIGEQNNQQATQPEVVNRLTALLDQFVTSGRSTPGQPQKNAVEIHTHREDRNPHKNAKKK